MPHLLDSLEYLIGGTVRQQRAYELLTKYKIFGALAAHGPVLTGTIPLNIDTDESDLDVACYWKHKESFVRDVAKSFSHLPKFESVVRSNSKFDTMIVRFQLEEFPVEIFAQNRPVHEQESYRHMMVEYNILQQRGESFRLQIIELKKQGMKTEPAFAKLLGLKGDPYEAMLRG